MDILTTNWAEKMKSNYTANQILNNPSNFVNTWNIGFIKKTNEEERPNNRVYREVKWDYKKYDGSTDIIEYKSIVQPSTGKIAYETGADKDFDTVKTIWTDKNYYKPLWNRALVDEKEKDEKNKDLYRHNDKYQFVSLNDVNDLEHMNNVTFNNIRKDLGDYDSLLTGKAPIDLYSPQHNRISQRMDLISAIANSPIKVNPLLSNFSS